MPARSQTAPLAKLVERGAAQVLDRLGKMSPLAWRLDALEWNVPPDDALYSFPRGGSPLDKLYGSYFSMPGAAVLAVFPPATAATLIQNFLAGFGGGSKLIPEAQALGEMSNILVNAIGGVLADACKFSFFLPPPDVFLAPKTDILQKLRHGVIQLQGPGQEPATLARILVRSAEFECVLLVLLGESWRSAVESSKR